MMLDKNKPNAQKSVKVTAVSAFQCVIFNKQWDYVCVQSEPSEFILRKISSLLAFINLY